jgi:hypothetical protein
MSLHFVIASSPRGIPSWIGIDMLRRVVPKNSMDHVPLPEER